MLRLVVIVLSLALPLGIAVLIARRVSEHNRMPPRYVGMTLAGGLLAGLAAGWIERVLLGWTELSFDVSQGGVTGALLAMFLLAAPLEEGLKVAVVWPLHGVRTMSTPRLGLAYAACAGAGFAGGEGVFAAVSQTVDWVLGFRMLLALPAHVFFAGTWGYALAQRGRSRGRWFAFAWTGAMLLHALYDHIVFGRGAGVLVLALPMLSMMAFVAWIGLRDVAPVSSRGGRRSLLASARIPEPPSLNAMRNALRKTDRPLMLHWIGIGALVTLGVVVVLLVFAVYLGHRIGVDFALADEGDVRASGPLVLLGTATLAGFPTAGYLVAKASAAESVLEPAMGAGLAIAAAVALVSLAAPVAAVFALAVAPLAFALACGGAWFGLAR